MSNKFRIIYKICIILIAILAALGLGALILVAIGASVPKTYAVIFFGPFTRFGLLAEVLIRMIPLTIIALGISVAYRSGIINIGGEGQMLCGIIGTTALALALPNAPKALLIPLGIIAGAFCGAMWGALAGWLRAKLQVSELLSTVMLNYIAQQLYAFCLRVPMLDPAEKTLGGGGGTPQSMRLTKNIWLSRIVPGTRLHTGIFIALALAVLIYFLLWKTSFGFKMRAAGASDRAARYGGISVGTFPIIAMMFSGGFAGIAGAIEVMGVHHRAIEGITSGYGFSGIVVALFGGLHPAGIIPAAFFFGLILVGGNMTQNAVGVPANMVDVLQGIIILVIVATQMVLSNKYLEERVWRRINAKKEAKS